MARSLEAVSFRRNATVEQLQLEYTHTHSQLYRIPRAATPRGINMSSNRGKTYSIAVYVVCL